MFMLLFLHLVRNTQYDYLPLKVQESTTVSRRLVEVFKAKFLSAILKWKKI